MVFSLLPNRRAATYVETFERLRQEAMKMNKTFGPKKNSFRFRIITPLSSSYGSKSFLFLVLPFIVLSFF